jgi:hypothetical protein
VAVNRGSGVAMCHRETRQRTGCTARFADGARACSAGSRFILTGAIGAEGLEIQYFPAHGIIVVTPPSGYAVFTRFVLRPS